MRRKTDGRGRGFCGLRGRTAKFAAMFGTAVLIAAMSAMPICAAESVTKVEYENLRELLKAGNFTLTQTKENLSDDTSPYENMRDILRAEQKEMERTAEEYEDDGDAEMQAFYEERAKELKKAAAQVTKQIDRIDSYSTEKSYEKSVDTLLVSAQTLMNSYNQLALQVTAQEKQTEAAKASCEEAIVRQSAGLMKEEQVSQLKNSYTAQQNRLATLKEQADEVKESLLTMLGLSGSGSEIGTIPEPDLTAIASIDFESDLQTAISNDKTYVSELTSSVKGSDARALKAERVETAAADETIDLTAAYQEILTKKTQYEAAEKAYAAAEEQYQALQRKKSAGMLSNADYLAGEADYASALADWGAAKMDLTAAYESYLWDVNGTV